MRTFKRRKPLLYLINTQTDPAINHAIEEYFLKETDEEIISLWQHDKTVLLGRNQDVYTEVDVDFCKENGLNIVRRLSGGGTIYCDVNNMQYSFIGQHEDKSTQELFEQYAEPIVQALRKIGIDAAFTGRNDIVVDGKKISGNAQYRYKHRILHHGTLLFDIDTKMLQGAIRTREEKYKGKGVPSVVSRIGTLSQMTDMDIHAFMDYIIGELKEYVGTDKVIEVDDALLTKVEPYITRFRDSNWNFGHKAEQAVQTVIKHPFGLMDYRLTFEEGKIYQACICGDYFSEADCKELEKELVGCLMDEESLKERLKEIPVSKYISGMEKEQLIQDLMEGRNCYEEKTRLD